MKVSQAISFHLQYHRANAKKNTIKTCEFVLSRFAAEITRSGGTEPLCGKKHLTSGMVGLKLAKPCLVTTMAPQALPKRADLELLEFANLVILILIGLNDLWGL